MPSQIVIKWAKKLMEEKLTIAFAESATGGRAAAELALVPHCGDTLKGGIVCYDACIKQDVLGVPPEVVKKYTPESAEVTKELAERLQNFMKADIQVAVTGLTMPGGSETPEKPVGTMFIQTIIKGKSIAVREVYTGTAEQVVLQTIDRIATLILDQLN